MEVSADLARTTAPAVVVIKAVTPTRTSPRQDTRACCFRFHDLKMSPLRTQYDGSFSLEIETGRIWSYLGASRSPSIAEIWSLTA